jgi:hypothetical protein
MDDACALKPKRQRQIALVEAAAQLRVEQVYAGSFDFNQNLAGLRLWQRQLLEPHDFGTAALVDTDRFHGRRAAGVKVRGRTG